MTNRLLTLLAAALAILVAGLALFWQPGAPQSLPATPAGGDFSLRSADGPVRLADYRGKLVLLYFGYTYCPDICPTSLAATGGALSMLTPAELSQVAAIFVSVDPRRDTPERLKEYASFFHPRIIGATASDSEIADLARRYGVVYSAQKVDTGGDGYVVDHSSETLVVDRQGRLVGRIAHGTPPDAVAASIRRYLTQP